MAIPGIPMPMGGMDAFIKGFGFNNDFMRQVQARNQLAEQKRQHMEDLKLRKQSAARAGAMDPLRQKILQEQLLRLQHSNDPNYEFQQFQNLMNMMGGAQQPGQPEQAEGHPQAMPQEAQMPYGEGQGMINHEAMPDTGIPMPQNEIAPSATKNPMDALKNNPMLRGFFKHKFGFDPLAVAPESPDQKRTNDLQSKIELENLKTQNKGKAIEQKEVLAVKKDLPTLEKSLKGVDELLKIAKTNPDMFGHGFMPDLYAKVSKNKNFGRWQNLISDAIAGLEQKLSARGNIVALKMASQLKPTHAEQQAVAIGKLESMRQQLRDSINHSREVTGSPPPTNDNQSMDLSQMSDEELQRIASGG